MNDHHDTPTDPGGHEPPPSGSHVEETVERFVAIVREAVHSEMAGLRRDLAAHQREELDHHRRLDANIELLLAQAREQSERIAILESRVARLEAARADTEPPRYVDTAEPGGEA